MNKKRYIAFFLTIILVVSSSSFGGKSIVGGTLRNQNDLEKNITTEEKVQQINLPSTASNGNGWNVNQSNTQVNTSNGEKVFSTSINFVKNSTGGDLFQTFEIWIRSDFFQSTSDITLQSPTVNIQGVPESVILFTPIGNDTYAGQDYIVYEAIYNSVVETDFGSNLANAMVELSMKVKTTITDEDLTETVVVIKSDNILLEITGPPTSPQTEYTIKKKIQKIYQEQGGIYSEYVVNYSNFPRPFSVKKGDIIYYSITLTNLTDTDIHNTNLYENLGSALDLLGHSFILGTGATVDPSTDNSKWHPINGMPGKTHQHQPTLVIPGTGTKSVTVYLYAKVNKDDAEESELNNVAKTDKESSGAYNELTGKPYYQARLIIGFIQKNNSVPRAIHAGIPETDPYQVVDGDELKLKIRLFNDSSEKITDTRVTLYVPDFFEFVDPAIEATKKGPVNQGFTPANARWKGLTEYELDKSVWSKLVGINHGTEISAEIVVKVKNLTKYTDPCDLYIGAEVSYFASADGTKNTATLISSDVIEDRCSYTDNDPYNDLTRSDGMYIEIDTHYQYLMGKTTVLPKEYDNTWNQNGKGTDLTKQDEPGFDYAFVIKNTNSNGDTETNVVKQRESEADALAFAHDLDTVLQSPLNGQNVVSGMTPLPDSSIPLFGAANTYYMKYTLVVNRESLNANIAGDIIIEDKLPDHFKLISAIVGAGVPTQYAIRFTQTGNSAGSAFSDKINIQFPSGDENHFKVIVPHTGTNSKFAHNSKEIKLEFLVKIDLSDMISGATYKNTATVSYDQKKTYASEKESITYGASNGKGYFNKYVFDPSLGQAGEYVGDGNQITLPINTDEISYRIRYITSAPLASGFVIKDTLENDVNIKSVDVTITGYNSAGFGANDEPINPQKMPNMDHAFTYTIEPGNKSISFKNTKRVGAFQHYDLEYTVKYHSLERGKLITNTVGTDTVKALKPLKIIINKTDNNNMSLAGTEFKAYYAIVGSGTANVADPVKDTANNDIVIYPQTVNNTMYFVPRGYIDSGAIQTWILILKETKAPSGFTGNIGKEYRIVVTKDIDGDLSYDIVAGQTDITLNNGNSSITIINKLGDGGGGTNPPSPPVDPNKPVTPEDPAPPGSENIQRKKYFVEISGNERENVEFLKIKQIAKREITKNDPDKGRTPSRGKTGDLDTGDSFHYYIIGLAVASLMSLIIISVKKKQGNK